MKRLFILLLLAVLVNNMFSQSVQNSRNGYYLPAKGTFRIFVVFAEVTGDPNYNTVVRADWPVGQMPNNPGSYTDLLSTKYQSYIGRYFNEASFGDLKIIGDYHPQLIQVPYNPTTDDTYNLVFQKLYALCNGQQIKTARGLNFPNDFDLWTLGISLLGQEKPNTADGKIDCIVIYWRVNSKISTSTTPYSGHFNNVQYSINIGNKTGISSYGRVYSDDASVFEHEFAHGIVGPNEFHSGGANSDLNRIYIQNYCGYSILSGWNRMHNSYNGWDRYWLGWKPVTKQHYISARNILGVEASSDLVYGQSLPSGDSVVYVLKNFATSGDAVRIKLPYLRSENINVKEQWLWLENHQFVQGTIEYNNNKHGTNSPMYKIPKGIYMNIQVGNETQTGSNIYDYRYAPNYSGPNYISPVNSFGDYDFTYSGDVAYMSDQTSNPFTGVGFASYHTVPIDNITSSLFYVSGQNTATPPQDVYTLNEKTHITFNFNGVQMSNNNWTTNTQLYHWGSVFDAFYQGNKISLTTNPAPVPRMTFSTNINVTQPSLKLTPQNYDNRKIYLNGLCVRVLEQMPNGDVKISVRWNDFKISNDVRWCGDIVLNEKIELQSNKTLLLDYGLTPTRPNNPVTINGKQVFADPTIFTCKQGSLFKANSKSIVRLKNNSTLIAESGSKIELLDNVNLTVESGSTLIAESGSEIELLDDVNLVVKSGSTLILKSNSSLQIIGKGRITVESGGYLCVENGANIDLQDALSVILLRDGAILGTNPALFNNTNCISNVANIQTTGSGAIYEQNTDVYIQNETISANRFVAGKNIFVGNSVTNTKPYGDVIITNNATVILDADNDVYLDAGVDVELGSELEIR